MPQIRPGGEGDWVGSERSTGGWGGALGEKPAPPRWPSGVPPVREPMAGPVPGLDLTGNRAQVIRPWEASLLWTVILIPAAM